MRALLVLLVLTFLFLLVRTGTGIKIDLNDINPIIIGYGALFTAGTVMAEVLRPLMVRLQPVARFAVIIALVAVVWLGIDRVRENGQFAAPIFDPDALLTSDAGKVIQQQIEPAWDGLFRAVAEINGRSVPVILNPGAPMVVLQYADAERLDLNPEALVFRDRIKVSDRAIQAAQLPLASLRIGDIEITGISAAIAAKGELETSLIGMTFFQKLEGVRFEGPAMILRQISN